MRRASAVALAAALVAGGCSVGDRGGDDRGLRAKAATCDAVDLVVAAMAAERGGADPRSEGREVTFAALVEATRPGSLVDSLSALLSLGLRDVDYGAYGPAMRYLSQRNYAWTEEFKDEVAMPKRTAAVVSSAKRLDRDLAAGMCPKR